MHRCNVHNITHAERGVSDSMKRSKFDSRLIMFFFMITLGGFTISHIESISGRYEIMEVRALLMSITLVLILLFLKWKSNKVEEWSLFYRERLTIVVSSITLGFFAWLLPTIIVIGGSIELGWATIEMEVSIIEVLFQALLILPLMLLSYILPEEWAFRGYIYRTLVKRRSMWVSIFIQALLFAVWGLLANGQLDGFIEFLGFGLFLGLLCHMTNTIWLGVGLRLAAATVPLLLHTINYEVIYMQGLLNFLLGIVTIVVAYLIIINVKRQQPNEVLNNLKKRTS